jgi:hypothetical protein
MLPIISSVPGVMLQLTYRPSALPEKLEIVKKSGAGKSAA